MSAKRNVLILENNTSKCLSEIKMVVNAILEDSVLI
jgi:hypothetical protein